jgi:ABC-2 type transport system ATP-binding protein
MAHAVELAGVSRRFGRTLALDTVDFRVRAGEVVALLGPNGAGKTTLVRIVLGLIRVDQGSASLWGLPPQVPAARRRVGAMLQVGRIADVLTVREHLHLFASYYGTPQPVDEVIAEAGVREFAGRRVGELSGGQRQRALFALALAGRPDLLVLDEPTVGLDPIARAGVWERVRQMRVDHGMTVLLTTHYMEEAGELCDTVALMHHGRLQTVGSPAELRAESGPDATLEDVFRRYAGAGLADEHGAERVRDVRRSRTTARKLG